MAKGLGEALAKAAPPPDKLMKPGGASEGVDSPEDEDKAAKVGAMQEFMDAAGIAGDAQQLCELFDRYLAISGY